MKMNKFLIIPLIIALILPNFVLPNNSYADTVGPITIEQSGSASGKEDTTAYLTVVLSNSTASDVHVILTSSSDVFVLEQKEVTVLGGTIDAPGTAIVRWTLDLSNLIAKEYTVPITASYTGGPATVNCLVDITANAPPVVTPPTLNSAVDVTHTFDHSKGLMAGETTPMTLVVSNKGTAIIKFVSISLSTLPDGVSLDNTSSSIFIGSIDPNYPKSIIFPVFVKDGIEGGNYPIGITVNGYDKNGAALSFNQTLYVPVISDGPAILSKLSIEGISLPASVKPGQDFTMTFNVTNSGNAAVKNLKITATGNEGIVNKSKNIFIESDIPGSSSKSYSVNFYIPNGSAEKYYPIEISVESSTSTASNTSKLSQFTGIFCASSGISKTPQLIVEKYSYGGSSVQAGQNIKLSFSLFNTSSSKDLSNIKVTITSDEGTFIPSNSSNSFYIASIGKQQRASKTLNLIVKPDAVQKTTSLTLGMTYEDGSGNEFSANDMISIPVVQKTKLTVDDIIAPPDLYPGQQMSVSVQFYNMGKTTLNNLKVTAEGNFSPTESTNYYVGNMEAGKNDYYDFSFIPNAAGEMKGNIIFSFEDQSGNQQKVLKEFSFQVMDAPPAPIDPGIPVDAGASSKLPWIIGGSIAALLLITGIIIWRIRAKKKKDRELEILDEK